MDDMSQDPYSSSSPCFLICLLYRSVVGFRNACTFIGRFIVMPLRGCVCPSPAKYSKGYLITPMKEEEEECYAADRSARACTVNDLLGNHFSLPPLDQIQTGEGHWSGCVEQ